MFIWWKDLHNIEKGVCGFEPSWMGRNLKRIIGNGEKSFMWYDGITLKDRYPCLFNICEEKNILISDMLLIDREERHQRFKWSRALSQEEIALETEIGDKIQI